MTWTALFLAGVACAAGSPSFAADWPQWRHDASRTAASAEQLPDELHLQWARHLPPLKPVWPDEPRQQFDTCYEPVVLGKMLFVSSNVNDSVTAFDTDTGAEKWRFYTDGPVRFAPVAWKEKLYFGSDDGHLYCLRAGDGKLLWKFCAAPSPRRVLGHERLISCWPVSGGPVLADGTIYFAAGIFPFEGTFVSALEAETGKVLWLNDSTAFRYADRPHGGSVSFSGPTPQGYCVAVADSLLEPTSSEECTLTLEVNDGGRVWFDGRLVIDAWDRPQTKRASLGRLVAGQKHPLRGEHHKGTFEATGDFRARLLWESPTQPQQPIPPAQFYLPDSSAEQL